MDAKARRATALSQQLLAEISETGPIGIDQYMRRCLSDPQQGYYTTRSGIGRAGDFTTAPEISQVFGELIGLWAAVVWQQMGAPDRVNLVELGPGRGVLMADALRAARVLPGFADAIDLHLCEINPIFREQQAQRLSALPYAPTWHAAWPRLNGNPTIVIANEFLDTMPARQWRHHAADGWQELCVGEDGAGRLVFVNRLQEPPAEVKKLPANSSTGIYTHADFSTLANSMAAETPLAALFIDYGHTQTGWGDTLQAVRAHKPEHPLASPGEADLSIAVDFAAVGRAFNGAGLDVDGPTTQAEFLGALGITERASKLMGANPESANSIESGIYRLMSATGMGTRFQVIGARSRGLAPLPGFA